MTPSARDLVRDRAQDSCEYCRLPAFVDEWPFHVDHIIAQIHGGGNDSSNLAWSCTQCNLHKGPNLASVDPDTNEKVFLFHPRQDSWESHFKLGGKAQIVGLTPEGRATVQLLDMNGSPQIDLRRETIEQGKY